MKHLYYLLFLVSLASCGYRYTEEESFSEKGPSISVGYIQGDYDAILNNELIYQLSSGSRFRCVQSGGDYTLRVVMISDEHERIGFRYDRDNPTGALEKNLLGVEDRRIAKVEVSLVESSSGKILLGPHLVSASADYDYTDPGSPRDLLFARKLPIIQFSLGQLDSYEGAYDGSARPLFRSLAQKIVMGLNRKLPEISS
jgi:hypothetical protein